MKTYLVLIITCVLFVVSGCDSGADTPEQPSYGGNVFPKMGSTYTYDYYMTDSNGNNIESSKQTQTATVISTDASYKGKTKVFQVEDNGANNYYTYETNGDVDVYLDQNAFGPLSLVLGSSFFSQWYMFPIASHIKGLIVYDTTIIFQLQGSPLPIEIPILGRIDYVGEETIQVGSEVLTAQKCKLKVTANVSILGTITFEQEISLIPKIGYMGKQTTKTIFPAALGGPQPGDYRILTSYTLAK